MTVNESRLRDPNGLLTPGEVASIFRVNPKTVTRWAKMGRISSFRTPGGHCRFRVSDVGSVDESGTFTIHGVEERVK